MGLRNYITVKHIQAEPMNVVEAEERFRKVIKHVQEEGYLIQTADGLESWMEKAEFERQYLAIGKKDDITPHVVDEFILGFETVPYRDGSITVARLANNVVVVNGKNIESTLATLEDNRKAAIKQEVWDLLEFMVKWVKNGLKTKEGKEL